MDPASHDTGPLLQAAFDGDLHELKLLHGNGARLDVHDDGITRLHAAIERKDIAMVSYLLKSGIEPYIKHMDQPDCCSYPPLHQATILGSLDIVRELLKVGAKDSYADLSEDGYSNDPVTSLMLACILGNIEVLRCLMDEDGYKLSVEAGFIRGREFIFACTARQESEVKVEGRMECIRYLLDKGCDITSRNEAGFTGLHTAFYAGGESRIIELLLQRGMDATTSLMRCPLSLPFATKGYELLILPILIHGVSLTVLRSKLPKAMLDYKSLTGIQNAFFWAGSSKHPIDTQRLRLKVNDLCRNITQLSLMALCRTVIRNTFSCEYSCLPRIGDWITCEIVPQPIISYIFMREEAKLWFDSQSKNIDNLFTKWERQL